MKKSALCLLVFLFLSVPAYSQGSFTDAFIRGAAAGASLRESEALREFYARQSRLAEAQARLIEAQIRQLEEAEKRAQAALVQSNDPTAPEVQAVAVAEARATLEVFTLIHPDWKQQEHEMVAFAQKIVPAAETSAIEYLEILYTLAKAKAIR